MNQHLEQINQIILKLRKYKLNLTEEQKSILDTIKEDSCKLLKINSVAGS